MMLRKLTAVSAVALAVAFATPSYAQSTINGKQVPEDQVARVQGRCDALAAGSAATGSLYPNFGTPAAETADAGAVGAAAAATEAAPGTPAGGGGDAAADLSAGGAPAEVATAAGGEVAADAGAAGGESTQAAADGNMITPLDLLTITEAACTRDGFLKADGSSNAEAAATN